MRTARPEPVVEEGCVWKEMQQQQQLTVTVSSYVLPQLVQVKSSIIRQYCLHYCGNIRRLLSIFWHARLFYFSFWSYNDALKSETVLMIKSTLI